MEKEFNWVNHRNLFSVYSAICNSETRTEKKLYKKLLLKGISEWSLVALGLAALISGTIIMPETTGIILASLK